MTYLDIAARGNNAPWRYVLAFVLGVVLTIVIGVVAMLYLKHILPPDLSAQMIQPTQPVAMLLQSALLFGLLLAGFWAAIALLHGKRFGDIIGAWRWPAFARGLGLWAVALVALSLLDLALKPNGFAVTANGQTAMLAAVALPALAIQTFAEEFVFRGYITQGLLLATRRPWLTAILSGLVFGSMHIPNGAPQAVNAVVFGVVLALIAIRTRGLAFGYGVHLINNLYGAVVVVSGGDVFHGSPGLFTQTTPGLMWADVAAATIALVLAAWLVLSGRFRVESGGPAAS